MAVSSRAKFLFSNALLRSTTVLSTNVSMLLPLANLQTPQRTRAAQFNAVSAVQIGMDLAVAQNVSIVAWAGTNLQSGASVQILHHSTSAFGSATLVEDVTHVKAAAESGMFTLDYVNFSVFDAINDRYWWVVLNDGSNPAGYLRVGVIGIGNGFEFPGNFTDGVSVSLVDESRTEYSAGGTPNTDSRQPARTISVDFSGVSDAFLWGGFYRILAQMGGARDFWFIPYPLATGTEKQELAMYGRFTSMPRIAGNGPTLWAPGGLTIRESL